MALVETVRVGCKINLNLFITGVRPNGWHELDSLFYPLYEPHDELCLYAGDKQSGFTMSCDAEGIDCAENTLTKAYALFSEATGFAPPLHLELKKAIPHGMGLGGGSADAAGLLQWLNRHAPEALSQEALSDLALRVGADVPFFLRDVPCRATGLGECLELADVGLKGFLVLVCPPAAVSTPWAYHAYDSAATVPDTQLFLTGSGSQAIRLASVSEGLLRHAVMVNDFEPVVFAAYPQVAQCKERLLQCGAYAACMSGSGAAVFGLFRTEEQAEKASRQVQKCPTTRVFIHRME